MKFVKARATGKREKEASLWTVNGKRIIEKKKEGRIVRPRERQWRREREKKRKAVSHEKRGRVQKILEGGKMKEGGVGVVSSFYFLIEGSFSRGTLGGRKGGGGGSSLFHLLEKKKKREKKAAPHNAKSPSRR